MKLLSVFTTEQHAACAQLLGAPSNYVVVQYANFVTDAKGCDVTLPDGEVVVYMRHPTYKHMRKYSGVVHLNAIQTPNQRA